MNTNHSHPVYSKCDVCGLTFNNNEDYTFHLAYFHSKPDVGVNQFSTDNYPAVGSYPPFSCSFCLTVFATKNDLDYHITYYHAPLQLNLSQSEHCDVLITAPRPEKLGNEDIQYLPPSPEDCVYQTDGMCDLIDDENPMLPSSDSDPDQNISQNLSYQDIQGAPGADPAPTQDW